MTEPRSAYSIIRHCISRLPGAASLYHWFCSRRLLTDVYRSVYSRRALLSYLTAPFASVGDSEHVNILECRLIAEALHEAGYSVDVVNWDCRRTLNYENYDLIFGMGWPIERACLLRARAPIIAYLPGSHPSFQNAATRCRLEAYPETEAKKLQSSIRIAPDWKASVVSSDVVIVLGNETTLSTFLPFRQHNMYRLNVPSRDLFDSRAIVSERKYNEAKKNFLFFSGSGLVHKGLDLLLKVMQDLPDCQLHICASFENEPGFSSVFKKELALPNVHTHDFVDMRSECFRQLMVDCAFVVLPSCSEGQSSGVVDVARNGGLIPVITKQVGIDIGQEGIEIKDLSVEGVKTAISAAYRQDNDMLRIRSEAVARRFREEHTTAHFKDGIRAIIDRYKKTS